MDEQGVGVEWRGRGQSTSIEKDTCIIQNTLLILQQHRYDRYARFAGI